jgi:hypothetical protein
MREAAGCPPPIGGFILLSKVIGGSVENKGITEEIKLPKNPKEINAAKVFVREIKVRIEPFMSDLLKKLDSTTPKLGKFFTSYRYPFSFHGNYLAPADYDEGEEYQGPEKGLKEEIKKFISNIESELKKLNRRI